MCKNNPDNCVGGLDTGNDICKKGTLGALCESCDIENIRGYGSYGKSCKLNFHLNTNPPPYHS